MLKDYRIYGCFSHLAKIVLGQWLNNLGGYDLIYPHPRNFKNMNAKSKSIAGFRSLCFFS